MFWFCLKSLISKQMSGFAGCDLLVTLLLRLVTIQIPISLICKDQHWYIINTVFTTPSPLPCWDNNIISQHNTTVLKRPFSLNSIKHKVTEYDILMRDCGDYSKLSTLFRSALFVAPIFPIWFDQVRALTAVDIG